MTTLRITDRIDKWYNSMNQQGYRPPAGATIDELEPMLYWVGTGGTGPELSSALQVRVALIDTLKPGAWHEGFGVRNMEGTVYIVENPDHKLDRPVVAPVARSTLIRYINES
jgi:hypothetical protein